MALNTKSIIGRQNFRVLVSKSLYFQSLAEANESREQMTDVLEELLRDADKDVRYFAGGEYDASSFCSSGRTMISEISETDEDEDEDDLVVTG